MSFVKNPLIEEVTKRNGNKAPAKCVHSPQEEQVEFGDHNGELIAIARKYIDNYNVYMAIDTVSAETIEDIKKKIDHVPHASGQIDFFLENTELALIVTPVRTQDKSPPKEYKRFMIQPETL